MDYSEDQIIEKQEKIEKGNPDNNWSALDYLLWALHKTCRRFGSMFWQVESMTETYCRAKVYKGKPLHLDEEELKQEIARRLEAGLGVDWAKSELVYLLDIVADAEAYRIEAKLVSLGEGATQLDVKEASELFPHALEEAVKQQPVQHRERPKSKRDRQAKVRKLWQENELDIPQMAARLFCSVATIKRDLREMGLSQRRTR